MLAACSAASTKSTVRPDQTKTSADTRGDGNASRTTETPSWTRAEWLRAAAGFVAQPATMPRLNNAASRPLFHKLVTTKAWLNHDWRIFKRNGAEFTLFFPALKKLTMTFMALNAVDELIGLGLYSMDVYKAFIRSGVGFIARLPAGDPTSKTRKSGLDKVRFGAAIGACGLLYLVIDGSEKYRTSVFDTLSRPAWYSFHSREGLQLMLATLDERLIKSGPIGLRPRYAKVRAVIAAEYGKRKRPPSPVRVTYQGLGPPGLKLWKLTTVVSTTGKFSVRIGPGGVAKQMVITHPNGHTSVQHRITLQSGKSVLEALCADGRTHESIAAQLLSIGLVPEKSQHSGRWLRMNRGGTSVRMRVLSIGGRGCVASVEGPTGHVPAATVESFLKSLRAAP